MPEHSVNGASTFTSFMSHLVKIMKLVWAFYQGIAFLNALITAIALFLFWEYGFSIFFEINCLKAAALGVSVLLVSEYKKNEFHYYRLLGISPRALWIISIGFDYSIFLLALNLLHHLR